MDEGADQRRGSDGGSVGDVFFFNFLFFGLDPQNKSRGSDDDSVGDALTSHW